MRQATIFVHPEVWTSICPEEPHVGNVAKYLLLPAEYKVTRVSMKTEPVFHTNYLEVIVASESIPDGVTVLKPFYTLAYIEKDGNIIRRETRFDHMESF